MVSFCLMLILEEKQENDELPVIVVLKQVHTLTSSRNDKNVAAVDHYFYRVW